MSVPKNTNFKRAECSFLVDKRKKQTNITINNALERGKYGQISRIFINEDRIG